MKESGEKRTIMSYSARPEIDRRMFSSTMQGAKRVGWLTELGIGGFNYAGIRNT